MAAYLFCASLGSNNNAYGVIKQMKGFPFGKKYIREPFYVVETIWFLLARVIKKNTIHKNDDHILNIFYWLILNFCSARALQTHSNFDLLIIIS